MAALVVLAGCVGCLPFPPISPVEMWSGTREPSGIVAHPADPRLWIAHDGHLLFSAEPFAEYASSGDNEGLAYTFADEPYLYVAIEYYVGGYGAIVKRVPLANLLCAGPPAEACAYWYIAAEDIGASASNYTIEALTFVRDYAHPRGGLFWLGHEAGRIYAVDLLPGGAYTVEAYLGDPRPGSLCGLHYERQSGLVYAVYRSSTYDGIALLDPAANIVAEYELPEPESGEEGIYTADCALYIAHDYNSSGRVKRYDGWTATPSEVSGVRWDDKTTMAWNLEPQGPTETFDVLWGDVSSSGLIPRGCAAVNLIGSTLADPSVGYPGVVQFYLVRADNSCGHGSYGAGRAPSLSWCSLAE